MTEPFEFPGGRRHHVWDPRDDERAVWSGNGERRRVTSKGSESMITVTAATPDDADAWTRMRRALWPEDTELEHREEVDRFFAGEFPRGPWQVLVAKDADGPVLGFAEVSVRTYAEACRSSRVAYLEGWFVGPGARKRGVGRALTLAAEEWGRSQGCTEFASDADPANEVSRAAHRAVGFTDVGLVRCFRKDL